MIINVFFYGIWSFYGDWLANNSCQWNCCKGGCYRRSLRRMESKSSAPCLNEKYGNDIYIILYLLSNLLCSDRSSIGISAIHIGKPNNPGNSASYRPFPWCLMICAVHPYFASSGCSHKAFQVCCLCGPDLLQRYHSNRINCNCWRLLHYSVHMQNSIAVILLMWSQQIVYNGSGCMDSHAGKD